MLPNNNTNNNARIPFQNIKDNNKLSSQTNNQNEKVSFKDTKLENKIEKLNNNISQSQEINMEIEDLFQNNNMKGSQSTSDSKNVIHSSELKDNHININCANSNIITTTHNNILLFEDKPNLQPQIPIPNPVMYQLSEIRKAIEEEKEIDIFKIEYKSKEEYILISAEYINDIYSNLLSDEKNLKVKPNFGYMEQVQTDIDQNMRGILIDWLYDIHDKCHYKDETLYQMIWIIDTYLSMVQVPRTKLQLVGAAALLISCKEHEITFLKLHEIAYLTANAYTTEEIAKMENTILKKLSFNIIAPAPLDFYNIISKAFKFDKKQYLLGKYFLETYLISYESVKYPASVVGVSCAYIVMKFFKFINYNELYSKDFINSSNPQKSIKEAAREICFIMKGIDSSRLSAVKNKYSTNENLNVVQLLEEQEMGKGKDL
jgi:cyclin B